MQRPAQINVSPLTKHPSLQLTSVRKSSQPDTLALAGAAVGNRAQLQQTAFSPQQPTSSVHISHLAAFLQLRLQKQ